MSWIRIDDQFAEHPKFASLDRFAPLAIALQMRALCYASRHLTDGRIPAGIVPMLLDGFESWGLATSGATSRKASRATSTGTSDRTSAKATAFDWPALMVRAGLWEVVPTGGFLVHDYFKYNPSRADVLAAREHKQAAGQVRAAQAVRRNGRFTKAAHQPAEHEQHTSSVLAACCDAAGSPLVEVPPAEHQPPSPSPTPKSTTGTDVRGESVSSGSLVEVKEKPRRAKNRAPAAEPQAAPHGNDKGRPTWLTPFGKVWEATYGGTPAYGELAKYLGPLLDEHPHGEILEHWTRYLEATEARFVSPARFAQTFGQWGKPARPTEDHRPDMYLTLEEQEARRARLRSRGAAAQEGFTSIAPLVADAIAKLGPHA